MFLAEVDVSKTACFMTTQTFSQEVTKFIPCDNVTRFDGIYIKLDSALYNPGRSQKFLTLKIKYIGKN